MVSGTMIKGIRLLAMHSLPVVTFFSCEVSPLASGDGKVHRISIRKYIVFYSGPFLYGMFSKENSFHQLKQGLRPSTDTDSEDRLSSKCD
jgi:hypothetical protein